MGQISLWSARQRGAKFALAELRSVTWGYLWVWVVVLVSSPVVTQAVEQAEVEYAKGVLDYDNRNYLDALEHLQKAVELTPDNRCPVLPRSDADPPGGVLRGHCGARKGLAAGAVQALCALLPGPGLLSG